MGLVVKLCQVAWPSLVSYLLKTNSIFLPNPWGFSPLFHFKGFGEIVFQSLLLGRGGVAVSVFLLKKGMVVKFYSMFLCL